MLSATFSRTYTIPGEWFSSWGHLKIIILVTDYIIIIRYFILAFYRSSFKVINELVIITIYIYLYTILYYRRIVM